MTFFGFILYISFVWIVGTVRSLNCTICTIPAIYFCVCAIFFYVMTVFLLITAIAGDSGLRWTLTFCRSISNIIIDFISVDSVIYEAAMNTLANTGWFSIRGKVQISKRMWTDVMRFWVYGPTRRYGLLVWLIWTCSSVPLGDVNLLIIWNQIINVVHGCICSVCWFLRWNALCDHHTTRSIIILFR